MAEQQQQQQQQPKGNRLPITEEENKFLEQIKQQSSAFAELDNETLIRFSRARNFDLVQTSKMLTGHLAWRARVNPDSITTADITHAMQSGCWRCLGATKDNNPILYVQARLWNPQDYDVAEYTRYITWFEERGLEYSPEGIVVIFDVDGWSVGHSIYLNYIHSMIDITQSQYPERLRVVYMLNVPWVFKAAWSVISPWMDARTAAKVKFLKDPSEMQSLLGDELMLEKWGGKCKMPSCPNIPGVANIDEI